MFLLDYLRQTAPKLGHILTNTKVQHLWVEVYLPLKEDKPQRVQQALPSSTGTVCSEAGDGGGEESNIWPRRPWDETLLKVSQSGRGI